MIQDLIYDVGMNNGDDTAFYLSKGYRVVSIEANPELVRQANSRFAQPISEKRLVVIEGGISRKEGTEIFWVNRQNAEWSSFDRTLAEKHGGRCDPISVRCLQFKQIVKNWGVPFYLKIDIEGADELCLEDLNPSVLPKYVSVEGHSLIPLFLLYRLGYRDFKCINQRFHNDSQGGLHDRSELHSAWIDLSTSAKATVRRKLSSIPLVACVSRRLRIWHSSAPCNREKVPFADHAGCSMRFPLGSSGPFGEETAGPWRDFESVVYDWLHIRSGHPLRSSLRTPGWFDFHARLR